MSNALTVRPGLRGELKKIECFRREGLTAAVQSQHLILGILGFKYEDFLVQKV